MFVSNQAQELFAKAQTLNPDDRDTFVTQACLGNRALLLEVNSLLKASEKSDAFFDEFVGRLSLSAIANNDEPLRRGNRVGQWRLGKRIGRGGMGTVYLAHRADGEFEKQAAIKLLPIGTDSESARDQLKSERQILARLVHDNIARLLDGGITAEGLPFFVMDYVDGQAIDDYVIGERLGVRQILQLMLDVANALQYAHTNLVVHRDLKPGNVLVEKNGRVRLLDFGIAKTLDPQGTNDDLTALAQRPVTPAFASPEMLRGEPVDVATDIYSVGALLYLLLTGRVPISYEGLSVAESITVASEKIPPPVSSLSAGVDSDLDTIIAKALAKKPSERYSSMDSLAADIKLFLAGRPITAKEPTAMYYFRKFLRRHAAALGLTLLVSIALLTTTLFALAQSAEARKQRDLALYERQKVQASNEFYGLLMEEMDATPFTSVELLDRGTELLQKQFGVDEAFMGPMLFELARRYARLQERSKQLELLQQAEALALQYNDDDLLAAVTCRSSGLYRNADPAKADRYVARGQALFAALASPSLEASVDCRRMLASNALRNDDSDAALAYMFEAQAVLDAHPATAVDIRGPVLGYIAHLYFNRGEREKALTYLDQTLNMLEDAGRGSTVGYLRVAANRAVTLNAIGRLDESLAAWEHIVGKLQVSGYAQRGASGWLTQYGETLTRVGRFDEAAEIHTQGLEIAVLVGDEQNTAYHNLGLARVALSQSDYTNALNHIREAQRFFLKEENAKRGAARSTKILTARIHRKQANWDEALATIDGLFADLGYPQTAQARGLDSVLIEAASLHQDMGSYALAEQYATEVIERVRGRAIGNPMNSVDVGRAYAHRAEIRASSGQSAAAAEDLSLAIPILTNGLGSDHQETVDAEALKSTL